MLGKPVGIWYIYINYSLFPPFLLTLFSSAVTLFCFETHSSLSTTGFYFSHFFTRCQYSFYLTWRDNELHFWLLCSLWRYFTCCCVCISMKSSNVSSSDYAVTRSLISPSSTFKPLDFTRCTISSTLSCSSLTGPFQSQL